MKNCTWLGCKKPAKNKIMSQNGRLSVHLCGLHSGIYRKNLKKAQRPDRKAEDLTRMIKVWIRANGVVVVKDAETRTGN